MSREGWQDEEDRGDLAAQLMPVAGHLACLVHGDGDARAIHQVIARLSGREKDALLVVLAGLVPPDVPLGWLLGYLTWDAHGRRTQAPQSKATPRDLAGSYRPAGRRSSVDEVAVIRALGGERIDLSPAERTAAVERGVRQGLDYDTVADVLGMRRDTVKRTWERRLERARARGEAWASQAKWTKAA